MTEDKAKDIKNPDYYDNREVSWLSFNYRVLQEAADKRNPLLERLGFLAIGSSNLDEFMMVRVAGLQDQSHMQGDTRDSKKHWTPDQQLDAIAKANRENVDYQYKLLDRLTQICAKNQIHFSPVDSLEDKEIDQVKQYFNEQIFPGLTPLGIDAYRPFPNLNNKVSNLFVNLHSDQGEEIAIVPIPQLLDRYYHFEKQGQHYLVDLHDIVQYFIGELFPGYQVLNSFYFRVTRNADLELHEEGAQDLLVVIEDYLKKRRNGIAVRIEFDQRQVDPESFHQNVAFLMDELQLQDRDAYFLNGPLDLTGLNEAVDLLEDTFPEMTFKDFSPVYPPELEHEGLFDYIEKKDLFLHHPYDSFDPIVEFISQAADDPATIAIKMTLYRVSSDSPIVKALKRAAENGKQVTVLVELKARFDEENNVQWAKVLEEAGCHVIYGKSHLKTHSKISLVVKRQGKQLKRYVHLGTGNYNDKTARGYTDMGVLTTNPEIGEDATNFFNYLSGYAEQPDYHHLHVSPFDIRDSYIEDINDEIEMHKKYGNGKIIAKMNSLTSLDIIRKLYEASQAGVQVDLIIRGICCLIPGIPGLSDNIRVISVVGRFLEHSRIYYFHNNGQEKLFLSSADMMTRNMIRRVEIEFPILDPSIHNEIMNILKVYFADNTKARYKLPDSSYAYVQNDKAEVSAQEEFMKKALAKKNSQGPSQAKKRWFQRLPFSFRK
ncbi:RNA degradosome polyphosphate kinase [Aerococcus sanguinicola]|uniref:RNA degradosome polyphosphate kinase n=1 Tax=unclassified Aerococcus TaxID=2618060 RepID=UPI0008A47146|nr:MULTISPECIES: RNA degradosome polyphosphate kinase [unclassified Aerococcus]KAB0646815.1 RNA degradosome polyphosphate kinase [Aerococcus sanguinicola]MDK6234118.1 RNA degradosome polyphosphate kinase [Aerococcus sp. UMB10185]MDK6855455.1 RNA degradosome polyphosphate kinase [Aerococcus sp. UMB7533]MDK8501633.1 RNA degradosome polyphosphate kinase [Aerococcus sp. UMB1112A]OFN00530.1 RNA degradosome polyphosphate kinase [Aerococcus sp. HMSC062A02]